MATDDIDRIHAVKKSAEGRLLAIPGVHAVGLGAKYVGGERTREPAIMVFVIRKKPPTEILPGEIIPTEIDGVKTDVVESAPPRMLSDDARYRPLRGGIQIAGGGSVGGRGTLGCIARVDTESPTPRIVGITNQHVVAQPPRAGVTKLILRIDDPSAPNLNLITIAGENTAGTLIVVELVRGQSLDRAFYATRDNQTLVDIATGVADAITVIGAGYSASAIGPRVTITEDAGIPFAHGAQLFGPRIPKGEADLRATVEGNKITFAGRASDNYGIYTNWNVGGGHFPSGGVFTGIRKQSSLVDVADLVAAAVKALKVPGLNAIANGSNVLIQDVHHVECTVSSDVRLGQPEDCLCSACCACCRNLVGFVTDARLDLDVALIELEPGIEYRAEIEGIGVVKGSRAYSLMEVIGPAPILVHKRGIATGRTIGWILAIGLVGQIVEIGEQGTPGEWLLFHRFYSDAIHIMSVDGFGDHGDSGSAVVNENNEVIGILFGGADKNSYVTPIERIEAAFDLAVETAAVAGQTRIVPATQGHAFSAVKPEPVFVDQLRALQEELTATPVGRELAEAGRRHAREVVQLVNHNRRVGAVWRRNGGPDLVQAALDLAQAEEKRLPRLIGGRPIADCLRRMQAILTRYGSAQLVADLRCYGPRIIEVTGFEYPQLLAALAAPNTAP